MSVNRTEFSPRTAGFSLVELLIAITISLVVLGALATMFASSSRSASEIERTNRQIENGQYSLQILRDDLEHAGFWGRLNVASVPPPASLPDPCLTGLADLRAALPVHIQGLDNGPALACLGSGVMANQDILVIRRASTCLTGTANCPAVAGTPYLQPSSCNSGDELRSPNWANFFRLHTDRNELDRTALDCLTPATDRRYLTHIYFLRNFYRTAGDGEPTLVRAELGPDGFALVPIASGIEALQLEYGIDTNAPGTAGSGAPNGYTASPSTFNGCADTTCALNNWLNVMAVRVHVLARSATPSPGYTDDKRYVLGLNADGSPNVVAAANDGFRRHVFQGVIRLTNAAMRRE